MRLHCQVINSVTGNGDLSNSFSGIMVPMRTSTGHKLDPRLVKEIIDGEACKLSKKTLEVMEAIKMAAAHYPLDSKEHIDNIQKLFSMYQETMISMQNDLMERENFFEHQRIEYNKLQEQSEAETHQLKEELTIAKASIKQLESTVLSLEADKNSLNTRIEQLKRVESQQVETVESVKEPHNSDDKTEKLLPLSSRPTNSRRRAFTRSNGGILNDFDSESLLLPSCQEDEYDIRRRNSKQDIDANSEQSEQDTWNFAGDYRLCRSVFSKKRKTRTRNRARSLSHSSSGGVNHRDEDPIDSDLSDNDFHSSRCGDSCSSGSSSSSSSEYFSDGDLIDTLTVDGERTPVKAAAMPEMLCRDQEEVPAESEGDLKSYLDAAILRYREQQRVQSTEPPPATRTEVSVMGSEKVFPSTPIGQTTNMNSYTDSTTTTSSSITVHDLIPLSGGDHWSEVLNSQLRNRNQQTTSQIVSELPHCSLRSALDCQELISRSSTITEDSSYTFSGRFDHLSSRPGGIRPYKKRLVTGPNRITRSRANSVASGVTSTVGSSKGSNEMFTSADSAIDKKVLSQWVGPTLKLPKPVMETNDKVALCVEASTPTVIDTNSSTGIPVPTIAITPLQQLPPPLLAVISQNDDNDSDLYWSSEMTSKSPLRRSIRRTSGLYSAVTPSSSIEVINPSNDSGMQNTPLSTTVLPNAFNGTNSSGFSNRLYRMITPSQSQQQQNITTNFKHHNQQSTQSTQSNSFQEYDASIAISSCGLPGGHTLRQAREELTQLLSKSPPITSTPSTSSVPGSYFAKVFVLLKQLGWRKRYEKASHVVLGREPINVYLPPWAVSDMCSTGSPHGMGGNSAGKAAAAVTMARNYTVLIDKTLSVQNVDYFYSQAEVLQYITTHGFEQRCEEASVKEPMVKLESFGVSAGDKSDPVSLPSVTSSVTPSGTLSTALSKSIASVLPAPMKPMQRTSTVPIVVVKDDDEVTYCSPSENSSSSSSNNNSDNSSSSSDSSDSSSGNSSSESDTEESVGSSIEHEEMDCSEKIEILVNSDAFRGRDCEEVVSMDEASQHSDDEKLYSHTTTLTAVVPTDGTNTVNSASTTPQSQTQRQQIRQIQCSEDVYIALSAAVQAINSDTSLSNQRIYSQLKQLLLNTRQASAAFERIYQLLETLSPVGWTKRVILGDMSKVSHLAPPSDGSAVRVVFLRAGCRLSDKNMTVNCDLFHNKHDVISYLRTVLGLVPLPSRVTTRRLSSLLPSTTTSTCSSSSSSVEKRVGHQTVTAVGSDNVDRNSIKRKRTTIEENTSSPQSVPATPTDSGQIDCIAVSVESSNKQTYRVIKQCSLGESIASAHRALSSTDATPLLFPTDSGNNGNDSSSNSGNSSNSSSGSGDSNNSSGDSIESSAPCYSFVRPQTLSTYETVCSALATAQGCSIYMWGGAGQGKTLAAHSILAQLSLNRHKRARNSVCSQGVESQVDLGFNVIALNSCRNVFEEIASRLQLKTKTNRNTGQTNSKVSSNISSSRDAKKTNKQSIEQLVLDYFSIAGSPVNASVPTESKAEIVVRTTKIKRTKRDSPAQGCSIQNTGNTTNHHPMTVLFLDEVNMSDNREVVALLQLIHSNKNCSLVLIATSNIEYSAYIQCLGNSSSSSGCRRNSNNRHLNTATAGSFNTKLNHQNAEVSFQKVEIFCALKAEELGAVLQARSRGLFDERAVKMLCASALNSHSGDVRLFLQLCAECLSAAERQLKEKFSCAGSNSTNDLDTELSGPSRPIVTLSTVRTVLASSQQSSSSSSVVDSVSGLSRPAQLLLLGMLKRNKMSAEMSSGDLGNIDSVASTEVTHQKQPQQQQRHSLSDLVSLYSCEWYELSQGDGECSVSVVRAATDELVDYALVRVTGQRTKNPQYYAVVTTSQLLSAKETTFCTAFKNMLRKCQAGI